MTTPKILIFIYKYYSQVRHQGLLKKWLILGVEQGNDVRAFPHARKKQSLQESWRMSIGHTISLKEVPLANSGEI